MKNKCQSIGFEKFLESNKITATPRRVQILKIILTIPNKEFSVSEMVALVQIAEPRASPSSVLTTLKLFRNKGLIKEASNVQISPKSKSKKGRPETRYVYHQME